VQDRCRIVQHVRATSNLGVNNDTEPVSDADTIRDLAQDERIIGILLIHVAYVGIEIRRMPECQDPVLWENTEIFTIESDRYIPNRRIQRQRSGLATSSRQRPHVQRIRENDRRIV